MPESTDGSQTSTVAPGNLSSLLSATRLKTSWGVAMFSKLGLQDKLLTPIILLTMIIGVIIGEFVPNVQAAFDTVRFDSVSAREYHSTHSDLHTITSFCISNSDSHRPHGNDVANPDQSAIRATSNHLLLPRDIPPHSRLDLFQLDHRTIHDAGCRLGKST